MNIILFDGDCHFCNRSVQFILKRDCKKRYHFAPLQSEFGRSLLVKHGIPLTIESLVLIEGGLSFTKSTAVLKISRNLNRMWKISYLFILVPVPIRNGIYDFIAKNRYVFGKKDYCIIPSEEERKRFLE